MTVAEVVRKMVEYSKGDLHDINHFMKVYAYAKTIAEGENLSPEQQKLVEVTDRKSTRLNSSHASKSRMPSSA